MAKKSSDDKRQRVLAAAQTMFSRYGYKRTSMEDIAEAAGMSRPALYLAFDNKEDVFRSLSAALQAAALAAAEAALATEQPFQARLTRAVTAKLVSAMRVVATSPHGAELFDTNTALAGDVTRETEARFRDLIATAFAEAARAGEIDPGRVDLPPERLANLLVDAIQGVKSPDMDLAALESELTDLVRVFLAGLAPG